MLRFLGGLAVGLLGIGLIAVLFFLGDGQLANLERWTRGPVERAVLTGHGADISRHGGVDVVLADRNFLMRQRCRGACDDLTPSTDFRWVRVTDARGGCVICRRLPGTSWSADSKWIGESVQAKPVGGAK